MKHLFACVVVLAALVSTAAGQQTASDIGKGKVVGLDYFYNHQIRDGKPFHYKWEDTKVSGLSKFGDIFKADGATLADIDHAPTPDDLKKLSVYIICNPCNEAKAADHKPNYIQPADIDAITSWVHDGGMLAIFANDEEHGGCEFVHLNQLSQKFGITFNNDERNRVPNGRDHSPGTFDGKYFPDNPIFAGTKMIFMKEVCTLQLAAPATPLLVVPKENNQPGTDIIMAVAQYGKGTVWANGDPWVYNEYIDLKDAKLPAIDNRTPAENLAKWFLSVSSAPQQP